MERNDVFTYRYSAVQSREVEAIRSKYLPKEENKLEALRRLDRKVSRAGQIQGLCLGIAGALTFGVGMCFGLDVFSGGNWMAAAICLPGALLMIPAYPVYRRMAKGTRERIAPDILRLSDEIIKSE